MVVESARHEIIAFTDDDCIVEERWLEAVERGFLRADNVGMVGGWVKHEPSEKDSIIDTYYSRFHHYKS
jgi:GT2 family glycosyltransferase